MQDSYGIVGTTKGLYSHDTDYWLIFYGDVQKKLQELNTDHHFQKEFRGDISTKDLLGYIRKGFYFHELL